MRIGSGIGVGIAAGILLACTGCRSKAAPVPPPGEPLQYDDDDDDLEPPAEAKGRKTTGPQRCKASGAPWDGKQEGCLYEVAGCCYPDAKSACAAADCEVGGCQILEFSPAQVTCRAE